ncbi:hypothetical protein [Roseibium album]|uniref:hypothetical protein n=1 Tax=Roseibium album TaxID=311410 RepID=UPI003BB03B9C
MRLFYVSLLCACMSFGTSNVYAENYTVRQFANAARNDSQNMKILALSVGVVINTLQQVSVMRMKALSCNVPFASIAEGQVNFVLSDGSTKWDSAVTADQDVAYLALSGVLKFCPDFEDFFVGLSEK